MIRPAPSLAKISTEEQKNGRTSVIVDELPYGVIRKNIVEAVAEAVKKDLIKEEVTRQRHRPVRPLW